ncbi:hypothetical protein [Streptomyces pseudoechinosporeus]
MKSTSVRRVSLAIAVVACSGSDSGQGSGDDDKVDVADLAVRNSSLTEDQPADLKRQLQQAGITTERVDIWVNDDDLLVKKVEKGELASGPLSSTAYYSDYGVEVSAEEPPAADTADFKDLVGTQPAA